MWNRPWKLGEGYAIGSGLVLTGLLLQFSAGPVRWEVFAWPANIIVVGLFVVVMAVAAIIYNKVYLVRYLASYYAAVPAISIAVLLTVCMGLIRQGKTPADGDITGFTDALTAWPFVLVYVWVTLILGLTTVRQILHFKPYKWTALACHAGLLVVLLCGTLGHADMKRLKMYCENGQPEWRALDDYNTVHELPIAVQLDSFILQEYPPKITLVDNKTMEPVMIGGKPLSVMLDDDFHGTDMEGWHITVKDCIDCAAPKMDSISTAYVPWPSPGATSAVLIKAENGNCEVREGWVTCGSYVMPAQMLTLDSAYSIAMPEREPERYASKVHVYSKSEDNIQTVVEVNKPLSVNGWEIYQYSFNQQMGRWSTYSVFELVTDPWLPVVYVGIGLLMVGALGLFFSPRKSRKEARL